MAPLIARQRRTEGGRGGHYEPFLAPYLERPCLRSDTPAVSSAARMTLYRTPGRSLTRPPRTRTDGVLLEIVALARDVGRDLHLVRQADARDLPKGRVRLLRGMREHARADAALLRRPAESRGLRLPLLESAALADELVDGGHEPPGKSVLTQQRSAGPMALPTGRSMVAKPERARKPRKPASGAEPEGFFPRFSRSCDDGFSYLQRL